MKKLAVLVLVASLFISCSSGNELKSNPDKSFAHFYNLGMSSMHKHEYNQAIEHFKRSLELNNNIARTHNELATCYMYVNKWNDATIHFEKVLSLDSSMSAAHNNLGVCYTNLKRYKDAELQFKTVLYDKSYNLKYLPLYNLGNIAFEQKEYDKALSYYEEALGEESRITLEYKIYLHFQIGNVHFIKRNYRAAYVEFEKVMVLQPDMLEAQYKFGVSAYYSGNSEDARIILRRVIQREPENAWAIKAQSFLTNMDK